MLAIEGEPPLIVNSVERYHKLFAAVGMDEFKVIFDPSHSTARRSGRTPQDLLLDLGVDRVGYVQFCDGDSTLRPFPNGGAGTSRHLPCGEGVYDIRGLCSILDDGGFEGWFQMDSWGTEEPTGLRNPARTRSWTTCVLQPPKSDRGELSFCRNGRPERTRTADLYRVKVAL